MRIRHALLVVAACLGTLMSLQSMAYGQEKASALEGLLIRARGIAVIPQADSTVLGIGGDVDVYNAYVPELDLTWFFTENVAVELIAAITPHGVDADNTTLGDVDLGHVWLLPPTLLLQYHHPLKGGFKPYIGAGVNYTVFFNEDAPGGTVTNIN